MGLASPLLTPLSPVESYFTPISHVGIFAMSDLEIAASSISGMGGKCVIPGSRELKPSHCRVAAEDEWALLSPDGSLGLSLRATTFNQP